MFRDSRWNSVRMTDPILLSSCRHPCPFSLNLLAKGSNPVMVSMQDAGFLQFWGKFPVGDLPPQCKF